ncbi:hypothetical protein BDZ97DRAFT_1784416 [Flammula alnicola]|nr:hypothetical protein BDZ97DRAFT_1784416 [Flammula alnicola]
MPLPTSIAALREALEAELLGYRLKATEIYQDLKTLIPEFLGYQSKSVEVSQYLNTLIPIAILPPEVLLKIFRLVATYNTKTFTFKHPASLPTLTHTTTDIRSVSQVSHHWRKLALASPLLWSQMLNCDKERAPWLRELLRRSGSVPVTIANSLHLGRRPQLFEDIMSAAQLVGSVEIYGYPSEIARIEHLLSRRLSTLISITLIKSKRQWVARNQNWVLRNNILLHSSGPFRRLELDGYFTDLNMPFFHNITELSISNLHLNQRPPVSEWIGILCCMRDLTHVSIKFGMRRDTSRQDVSQLQLRRLQTLGLAGKLSEGIDQFLDHISTPSGCSLYLAATMDSGDEHEYSQLLRALEKWFNSWPGLPTTSKHMSISACPDISRFIIHNQGWPPSESLWFRISLKWRRSRYLSGVVAHVNSSLASILDPILSKATLLTIWSPEFAPYQDLVKFMLPFRSVHTLRISCDRKATGDGVFRDFLRNHPVSDTASALDPLPLPSLVEIQLEGEPVPCQHYLEPVMRWRKASGVPLQRVSFFACPGAEKAKEILEAEDVIVTCSPDLIPRT